MAEWPRSVREAHPDQVNEAARLAEGHNVVQCEFPRGRGSIVRATERIHKRRTTQPEKLSGDACSAASVAKARTAGAEGGTTGTGEAAARAFLDAGELAGQQVVPATWVDRSTTTHIADAESMS